MKCVPISTHAVGFLFALLLGEGSALSSRREELARQHDQHGNGGVPPSDHLNAAFIAPQNPLQVQTLSGPDALLDPPHHHDAGRGQPGFLKIPQVGVAAATDGMSPPARGLQVIFDVCEASTIIEFLPGESSVTVQTRNDVGFVGPNYPCFVDSDVSVASFLVVGTGNNMYATTCVDDGSEVFIANVELSSIGEAGQECSSTGVASCLSSPEVITSRRCASRLFDAPGKSWNSEQGVLYQIVVTVFLGDIENFALTVGETGVNPPVNDDCPAATPLEPVNGVVTVAGTNEDASQSVVVRRCNGDDFASLWYSVRGTGKRLTASTCSPATTFQTSLGLLESLSNEDQPLCDDLSCLITDIGRPPCEHGTHASLSWLGRLDTIYILRLSSASVGVAGTFELTLTESDPVIATEKCQVSSDLYEKENPNTSCECLEAGDTTELTCIHYCVQCNTGGSTCITKTKTATFFDAQNEESKEIIQQSGGRSELIEYSILSDGSCTLQIDGAQCSSCTIQACGQPLLDCSNIDSRLDAVDMCEVNDGTPAGIVIKANVISSALYGLLSNEFEVCSFFLSEESCSESLDDLQAQNDSNCVCTRSDIPGRTNMVCPASTCGYSCNVDESICFIETSLYEFGIPGPIDVIRNTIEYKIGNEDTVGDGDVAAFTVNRFILESLCDVDHEFPFWSCVCELVDCGDGSSLPELACTNFSSDETFGYNYCSPTTVDVAPFVALSEGDFTECVDKSPANDMCMAAIPVAVDELIAASTQHILQTQYDACLDEDMEGAWYTFVGTGDFLQVSPCTSGFNAATRITIQKGSCDALECVADIQFDCQKLVWLAEAGVTYSILISTDQSDVTMHDFRVESILPSMQGCLQDLEDGDAREDLECECLYIDSTGVEAFRTCTSICDGYCSSEACGQISLEASRYDETGLNIGSSFEFQYSSPWTDTVFLTIDRENDTCEGGISGDAFTPCTSCKLVECPDSDAVAPLLDCLNFRDGGTYNLCEDLVIDEESRFQAWDDGQLQCILNGTVAPTSAPSDGPTAIPITDMPSVSPSTILSRSPTVAPSRVPSSAAPVADVTTSVPTSSPTKSLSQSPVVAPTADVNTASAVPSSGEVTTDAPVGTADPVTTTSAPTASSSWKMQLSGACTFIVGACTVMLSTMN